MGCFHEYFLYKGEVRKKGSILYILYSRALFLFSKLAATWDFTGCNGNSDVKETSVPKSEEENFEGDRHFSVKAKKKLGAEAQGGIPKRIQIKNNIKNILSSVTSVCTKRLTYNPVTSHRKQKTKNTKDVFKQFMKVSDPFRMRMRIHCSFLLFLIFCKKGKMMSLKRHEYTYSV